MKRFFHSVNEVIFLDGDDVRRAPMAAALFERFARRDPVLSSWNIDVRSAGSGKFTKDGASADALAKEAMLSMGLDISSHRAKTITSSDIERASIILAIEPKHKKYVDEHVCSYRAHRGKIVFFFDYLAAIDPLKFNSVIGSMDLSEYLDFAINIDSFFLRIAYMFTQDTYMPLLARGHGFGTAIVEGVARKFTGELDSAEINKGDVLICSSNHIPGRLPEVAGAIVTDSHSEKSHLSEIAFEHGIPCVGGTTFATKAIPDGETVLVDSTGGLVYQIGEE